MSKHIDFGGHMVFNEHMTSTPMTSTDSERTIIMSATITPNQLATELGCDAKMCRKFLRSIQPDRATKGGRWAINASDVPALKSMYATWRKARTTTLVLPQD